MQGPECVLPVPPPVGQGPGQHVVAQVEDLEVAELSGVRPVLGDAPSEPAVIEARLCLPQILLADLRYCISGRQSQCQVCGVQNQKAMPQIKCTSSIIKCFAAVMQAKCRM